MFGVIEQLDFRSGQRALLVGKCENRDAGEVRGHRIAHIQVYSEQYTPIVLFVI